MLRVDEEAVQDAERPDPFGHGGDNLSIAEPARPEQGEQGRRGVGGNDEGSGEGAVPRRAGPRS